MTKVKLLPHQELALEKLATGSILCGRVGSGKSITALAYYYLKECNGKIINGEPLGMDFPKDLFIITTAKKRDSLDWNKECSRFNINATIDSWNNIGKYIGIENSFFIFDEQRVVGSGAWVKSFLKITKFNNWILLSATPGDTWLDYIPVFIANNFYKNRTEFLREHVVYNNFTKFPKVDHYIETGKLIKLRKKILVDMAYEKKTQSHIKIVDVNYNKELFELAYKKRWNPYKDKPITGISEYCYILRKIVNSDPSRIQAIKEIIPRYQRVIIFYNFDYELEILRTLKDDEYLGVSEYNGHKHEDIPNTQSWAYLVQYISGSEGWNCIESNTIVFYSRDYSYRRTAQAAGRIDRLNTPYGNLYYFFLSSNSPIDLAIAKTLKEKRNFNESVFLERRKNEKIS